MTSIVIVDYGIGNVVSISRAFKKCGVETTLTQDLQLLKEADGLILPGVGAFPHGMQKLREKYLDRALVSYAQSGKPILGICLGMQLLFDASDEFHETPGLGVVPGFVRKLEIDPQQQDKLPHVSWNEIEQHLHGEWNGTVLQGVKNNSDVYFVHSYHAMPANREHIISTTSYGGKKFCSTVRYGNIYGCQYHPEKSGKVGLNIIRNFIEICRE